MNYLIKKLVLQIVKSLRLKTVSMEGTFIMVFLFALTFFNTILIVLIVNCNFKESSSPILRNLLQIGTHTDFDKKWYRVIGRMLLLTVSLNTIVPVVMEGIWAAFWFLQRAYDNGCFKRKY